MERTRRRGHPNPDVVVEAGVATVNAATGLQMGGSETGQEVEVEAGAQEGSVIASMSMIMSMSVKTEIIVIPRLGDGEAKVQMIALGGKKAHGRTMVGENESPVWSGKMAFAYYDTRYVIYSLLHRRRVIEVLLVFVITFI
jgi:hypothetical protein